ncbi:SAF domain-containing protein, partial [Dehalococcoidia bacterium]|nr:SAF domain-containing protein [Dehalococcoidia bacterium]
FARTLGAMVFEKHYTVDKTLEKSADHWLSVDPPELMEMIAQIRLAETLLGTSEKQVGASEERARAYARRSVVAANDLMKGTVLTHENLTCKRPGTGIQPKFLEELVGKKLNQDVPEDTLLTWEVVEA